MLMALVNLSKEIQNQECPLVELNWGVDPGPTGFFRFRIEFGLRFV